MNHYKSFQSWEAVLAHVAACGEVYYHAPLDFSPRCVRAKVVTFCRRQYVRICRTADYDSFLADSGHFSRFRETDCVSVAKVASRR